jgi:NAD(P)-dependent dehydrogenase (short-subunit alcohol dehydrogenase family)
MALLPLEGQVALVTGAAKRIGRRIALRLAAEGASLVVNYNHSEAEAEEVVREIRASGRRAIPSQADVSRRAEVREMFAVAEREFGRLDILVNNAGVYFPAKFDQLTEEQWDAALNVNLKAQFLCAQAAAPLMKRHGRGRIVNFASIGGVLARPDYIHYCVSKAGVIMLTRCLARALAPEITVNSISPGKIQFPGEVIDEGYIRKAPLARVGTGDDIADAVLFLVHADFITGQNFLIDGGRTLV